MVLPNCCLDNTFHFTLDKSPRDSLDLPMASFRNIGLEPTRVSEGARWSVKGSAGDHTPGPAGKDIGRSDSRPEPPPLLRGEGFRGGGLEEGGGAPTHHTGGKNACS